MELVKHYIGMMPGDISADDFCTGVTEYIFMKYEELHADTGRLKKNPVERPSASAVVYSAAKRQVWMIGDCQCIANGQLYDNPKPMEADIAARRSAYLKQALQNGLTVEEAQIKDPGRAFIINDIISGCALQNIGYSVIDGYPIPKDKVRVIDIDGSCREVILASDGYPFLKPTLAESEEALRHHLDNDPLCIGMFKATKGLMKGNKSFDDRSYIRFSV